MKISDFLKVIEKMPKRNEGKSILNPSQHFIRLCESHELTYDNDVLDFFELLQSEDFFAEVNMPKDWGIRSYASALKSIYDILKYDKVQEHLNIDIEEVSQYVDKQRKHYNNIYKKQQRKKITDKTKKITKMDDNITMKQTNIDKIDIDIIPEKENDSDEEPHIMSIDMYMQNDNDRIMKDETDKSEISIRSAFSEKHKENKNDSTINMYKTNEKNDQQIQYIISLLDKYMQHESDEFKKVYLEVVRDQILMLRNTTH